MRFGIFSGSAVLGILYFALGSVDLGQAEGVVHAFDRHRDRGGVDSAAIRYWAGVDSGMSCRSSIFDNPLMSRLLDHNPFNEDLDRRIMRGRTLRGDRHGGRPQRPR